jgi:hypothetical protein
MDGLLAFDVSLTSGWTITCDSLTNSLVNVRGLGRVVRYADHLENCDNDSCTAIAQRYQAEHKDNRATFFTKFFIG